MPLCSPQLPEAPVVIIRRSNMLIIMLLILAAIPCGVARAQSGAATPAAAANPAGGSVVRIPLTIDYLALGAAMNQQLYTDHGRAALWNGSDQCQYFYVQN